MNEQVRPPSFADGKAPDALRTIGEVSNALAIRQHVLRYWEEQFPSLKPIKRSGGRRYYRPEDVRLLVTIDRLVHREGYTLRGARQAIESGSARLASAQLPAAPGAPGGATAATPSSDMQSQLAAIRASLSKALAAS